MCVSLKAKLKTLEEIDDEIFLLVNENEIENEVVASEELKTTITSFLIQLEAKRGAPCFEGNGQAASFSSHQLSSPQPFVAPECSAILPKIQLPKFSGDPKKWPEWWDAFLAVHENGQISNGYKFRHLKSLLEGQAAAAIAGIQITGENYPEAIEILENRFAQRQVITNAHMETLLNIPSVISERDIKSLRKLYEDVESNVRSLKPFGVDFNQYGSLLIPMIVGKIPEEMRLVITKDMGKDDWGLEKVLEILSSEIEARELNITRAATVKQNRTSSLTTTSALYNDGGKVTCSFCKGSHPSVKCNIITNSAARKDILRKQGRCFVCLKKGHLARECASNIRCHNCKQRHHASICGNMSVTPVFSNAPFQNQTRFGNPQHQRTNSLQPRQLANNAPVAQSEPPSTTTMYIDAKNSVLLQTAKGYFSAAQNPQHAQIARLIFDTGSQRTYISQRLQDALCLPTIAREVLSVKVFGSSEATIQVCDVVQVCVRSPYNDLSIFITAHVIPLVCAPLKNQAIHFAASHYPHISTLPLADYPNDVEENDLDIEVLIGLDFYWVFMSGGSIRGEQGGPIALESKLGWVLSGPVPVPSLLRK